MVALAALVGRELFAWRPAGTAHRDAVGLDDRIGSRVPVLLVLDAAARIAFAVEGVHVPLLLVRAMLLVASAPPSEHGIDVPVRPLH